MNPALFFQRCSEHAAMFPDRVWIIASVLSTRGSTPRKAGAQMALAFAGPARVYSIGSIGGGAGEARVLAAANDMIARGDAAQSVEIDLRGQPDAASTHHDGVCGGSMHVQVTRVGDPRVLLNVAERLQQGRTLCFDALLASESSEANHLTVTLTPWPRVLVSGAGHCGQALMQVLEFAGFDAALHDQRGDEAMPSACNYVPSVHSDAQALDYVAASDGPVWWLLLSRNLQVDVQALSDLPTHAARSRLQRLGVMGSSKRLRHLHDALPWLRDPHAAGLREDFQLIAPIGLDTGESPEAIAVGIVAQLLQWLANKSTSEQQSPGFGRE
jgi:xanthine dehydrogenase accessory factor